MLYELRHAQERNVTVECHVEPGINAWGDVRLMMTVLRNLFGNAWKFTARTATGRDSFLHRSSATDAAGICVTDNGAGFDMTQAARLFKPFTRLHRQDEFPGHGMGLATVHRIVKRHGGDIEAEGGGGQGTTIRFWLPRRRRSETPCARARQRWCVPRQMCFVRHGAHFAAEFVVASAKS